MNKIICYGRNGYVIIYGLLHAIIKYIEHVYHYITPHPKTYREHFQYTLNQINLLGTEYEQNMMHCTLLYQNRVNQLLASYLNIVDVYLQGAALDEMPDTLTKMHILSNIETAKLTLKSSYNHYLTDAIINVKNLLEKTEILI